MAELAEDLKTEYRANGRRSLDRVEDAIDHLLSVLGTLPAIKVTSADVRAYQAKRQTEGAANATINRECEGAQTHVLGGGEGRTASSGAAHRNAPGAQRAHGLL